MLSKDTISPVATLRQVIENQAINIQMVQLEMSKSHIDEKLISNLLWRIRQANIIIQGALEGVI